MLCKEICTLLIVMHCASINLAHLAEGTNNSRIFSATTGFCNENQSVNVNKTVNATREVIRKKGRWPFRKTVVQIEYYEETVPHMIKRTVVRCCAGYQMNKQQQCVPKCEPVCPLHADCISSNTCKCHDGYKEIRELADGQETAVLQCLLPSIKVETEMTDSTMEYMEDDSTTWQSSTDNSFEANNDCRISDCPKNAKCLENGTCVCLENYILNEQRTNMANESGMQVDIFCSHDYNSMEARDDTTDSFSEFLFKLAAILTGVALAVGLSAIIIWRYKQQQQQHDVDINVEDGKITDKNMCCKYVSDKEEDATAYVVY